MTDERHGPWTCPKCKEQLKSGFGSGSHLKWCGRREEFFWSKVNKGGKDECWLYEGTISFEGYGYVNIGSGVRRQQWQAHRFAWNLLKGPIPDDKFILHHCDIRNCCNPEHLYLGDHKANARDRVARRRDPTATLTYEQAAEVKTALLNYRRGMCAELAAKYGVSRAVISQIKMGNTYQHVRCDAAGERS